MLHYKHLTICPTPTPTPPPCMRTRTSLPLHLSFLFCLVDFRLRNMFLQVHFVYVWLILVYNVFGWMFLLVFTANVV